MQVYLTPDQHDALKREAERTHRSMTAIVRDLIETHIRCDEPPPHDFGDLIGSLHWGGPEDTARDWDEIVAEQITEHLRRYQRP